MLKAPLFAAVFSVAAAAAANAQLTPAEPPYADPLSAPPTLIAGDTASDGGWRVSAVSRHVQRGEDAPVGQALYTEDSGQPGLIVRCNDGRLRVGVSLEGADFRHVLATPSLVSMMRATVEIGDDAPFRETWGFLTRHKVAYPRDAATAARLYNAAAKGERIRVSIGRYRNMEIALPPPSPSAFAAFIRDCSLAASAGR